MLTLARLKGQSVMVGDNFIVAVAEIEPDRVLLVVSRKVVGDRLSFRRDLARQWVEENEVIAVGDGVSCSAIRIERDRIRLGFICPPGVAIHRTEVYEEIQRLNDEGDLGTSPSD